MQGTRALLAISILLLLGLPSYAQTNISSGTISSDTRGATDSPFLVGCGQVTIAQLAQPSPPRRVAKPWILPPDIPFIWASPRPTTAAASNISSCNNNGICEPNLGDSCTTCADCAGNATCAYLKQVCNRYSFVGGDPQTNPACATTPSLCPVYNECLNDTNYQLMYWLDYFSQKYVAPGFTVGDTGSDIPGDHICNHPTSPPIGTCGGLYTETCFNDPTDCGPCPTIANISDANIATNACNPLMCTNGACSTSCGNTLACQWNCNSIHYGGTGQANTIQSNGVDFAVTTGSGGTCAPIAALSDTICGVGGNYINYEQEIPGTLHVGVNTLAGFYAYPDSPQVNPSWVAGTACPSTNDSTLVAYYPLDGNPNDASGNGNNGTAFGGVSYVSGKVGQAASLDGTTGYISIPDSPSLRLSTFTLAAWVNPTAIVGDNRIAEKGTSDSYYLDVNPEGKALVGFFDGTYHDLISPTALVLNTWSSVAGTYDGTVLRLYVNGTLVNSLALVSSPSQTAEPLVIGWKFNGITDDHFAGLIDELRLYNRALTDSEIQQHYQLSAPAISVSPSQITFPPTVINTTSQPVQVTVSNTGTANLVISDIATQDPFAITNFSSNITTGITPHTQGTFDALFRPITAGLLSGSITITSNAPTSPTTVSLQGSGVLPPPPACNLPVRPVPDQKTLGYGISVPWATAPHNGIDYRSFLGNQILSIGPGGSVHKFTKADASRFGSINPDGAGPAIWITHTLLDGTPVYVLYGHTATTWVDNSTVDRKNRFHFDVTYTIGWTAKNPVGAASTIGFTAPFYLNGIAAPHLHISVFVPNKSCKKGNEYCDPPLQGWGYSALSVAEGNYVDPDDFFSLPQYCIKE
jgi:hypothetical protein